MSLEDKIERLTLAIELLNSNLQRFTSGLAAGSRSHELIPLPRWNDKHDWPSIAALRNIVFNENYNGAKIFIKRIGRRIFIDEEKFFEWARSNPKIHIAPLPIKNS